MSDLENLQKMIYNFAAGNKDAASKYLSMVLNSKSKKIVNESKKKAGETHSVESEMDSSDEAAHAKNDTPESCWEAMCDEKHWYVVNKKDNKKHKVGPKDHPKHDYKKMAHEKAKEMNEKK